MVKYKIMANSYQTSIYSVFLNADIEQIFRNNYIEGVFIKYFHILTTNNIYLQL